MNTNTDTNDNTNTNKRLKPRCIRLDRENEESVRQYQKKHKVYNFGLAINHKIRICRILERFIESENRDDVTTWYTIPSSDKYRTWIDEIPLEELSKILHAFVKTKYASTAHTTNTTTKRVSDDSPFSDLIGDE